jgi:hypothetical protein
MVVQLNPLRAAHEPERPVVFGVHEQWVSRAARVAGEPVRSPGRKKATTVQV